MPKKAHLRKKAFQLWCKTQNRKGLVNAPDGSWVSPSGKSGTGTTDEMHLRGSVHG
jgi:hypothetical protein